MAGRRIATLGALLCAMAQAGTAVADNRAEALAALRMAPPAAPGRPPDFTLPTLGGGRVRLTELRGTVVLLTFWATRCPPCIVDVPGLQTVQQVLGREGFVVLAVNVGEAEEEVRAFARDLRLNFPVARDPGGAVTNSYRIRGLPTTVLIDRDGRVVGRAVGGRDWTQDAALHLFLEVLREPVPVTTRSREIGGRPHNLAASPDGRHVFVTDEASARVWSVTVAEGRVAPLDLRGRGPHGIALTPNGTRLLVAPESDALLQAFDARTGAPLGRLALPDHPHNVAVSPDGREAWLTSVQGARRLTVVALPDLRLVSITVDPAHDTPEVLARFAERYGADPERWLFLTGPKPAIYALARDGFKLGIVDPDDRRGLLRVLEPRSAWATHGSGGLVIHSSRFVLVDREARVRAYHRPDEPESLTRLRKNLRALLAER